MLSNYVHKLLGKLCPGFDIWHEPQLTQVDKASKPMISVKVAQGWGISTYVAL